MNYNTKDLLVSCIESIRKYCLRTPYEIIVVDNASTDDSVNELLKVDPNVVLISNLENKGFGTANNQGVRIAMYDYIFLLNSDTILESDVIANLELFMNDHIDCAGVTPRILFPDRTEQNTYGNFPTSTFFTLNSALHDPAARTALRAELGVQEGEILFGHVGRFCEQKNHAGLLRIFAGVSRRMPNARLVLIGTGELVDSTRALAQELNLSDRVIFAGVRKDMAALYHAMDVFLLPSLFEGLPVVLVEAQAAGLPCFVADTVDPGAAFAGNIHYLPLQNEAAWADSIAAADLTRDPNAQAKAIAAGFDVHTSAGILQKFYLEQTQKYTKEVQP